MSGEWSQGDMERIDCGAEVVTKLYCGEKIRFVNDQESSYLHESEESTLMDILSGHFLTSSYLMFIIHYSHRFRKISLVCNNTWNDEKGKVGLIFRSSGAPKDAAKSSQC